MTDLFGHPEKNGWREAFLEFKSFYPRKQAWAQAEKTFRRLYQDGKLPDITILHEAVTQQKESGCLVNRRAVDGRDVRPLPSSWLMGRRWEDETAGNGSRRDESVALEMLRRRPISDFNIQEIGYILQHADLNPIIEQQLKERLTSLDPNNRAQARGETSCRSSGPKQ